MYSLSDCPTCEAARAELREQGTAFEERVVDEEPRWRAEVLRLTHQRTVPVFVKGDEGRRRLPRREGLNLLIRVR